MVCEIYEARVKYSRRVNSKTIVGVKIYVRNMYDTRFLLSRAVTSFLLSLKHKTPYYYSTNYVYCSI